MFQFPALAPHGLYIHPRVTPSTCVVTPGCPIRRSLDQRMFDSSPEHIAAYHVLHRLSIPRHPPYTLNSLITLMKRCRVSASSRQQAVDSNTDYHKLSTTSKSSSRLVKTQSASSFEQPVSSLPTAYCLLPTSSGTLVVFIATYGPIDRKESMGRDCPLIRLSKSREPSHQFSVVSSQRPD